MESNRLKKVATVFQEELSKIFRKEATEHFPGYLLTVSEVKVSPDLSFARVFVSIFPAKDQDKIIGSLIEKAPYYRSLLARTAAKSMRFTPELIIKLDTSLEDMEKIDRAIRGDGDNPIL